MLGYALIFGLGYLLTFHIKKDFVFLERLAIGFFLGIMNVTFVVLSVGSINLSLAITMLIAELYCLGIIHYMDRWKYNHRLIRVDKHSFSVLELSLFSILIVGVLLKMNGLFGYLCSIAWDSDKIYLSWGELTYLQNKIPLYEFGLNMGYPVIWGIVNIILTSVLYWFNGGINYLVAYSLSFITSIMTLILTYYTARKYLDSVRSFLITIILCFIPFIFVINLLPYAEPISMFCYIAFIYFIFDGDIILQSLAVSMTIIVKYTGVSLIIPSIIYSLKESKTTKNKIIALLGLLPCILWLIRNCIIYGSPMPSIPILDKIFLPQNLTENLLLLIKESLSLAITPLEYIWLFLTSEGLFIGVIRTTMLVSAIALTITPKIEKPIRYTSLVYAIYVIFMSLSQQTDMRHFIPTLFIPLFALSYYSFRIEHKYWYLGYVLMILASVLPISFFGYTYFSLATEQIMFIVFVSTVILYPLRKLPKIRITFDSKVFGILLIFLLMFLQIRTYSYNPLQIVKQTDSNWYYGAIPTSEFISILPKTSSYYLIGEDPGTRFFAHFNSGFRPNYYELNDYFGNLATSQLFDKPGNKVNAIFFGWDNRRTETVYNVSGFVNVDAITARFSTPLIIWREFDSDIYIIIHAEGNYTILRHDSLIQLIPNGDVYIHHIIFGLKSYFDSPSYGDIIKQKLSSMNVKYIIAFYGTYGVWFYKYYSLFTYIEVPSSESLFRVIYTAENWKILELRD